MFFDLSQRPEGTPEQQVQQLWEFVFKLTEKINMSKMEEEANDIQQK